MAASLVALQVLLFNFFFSVFLLCTLFVASHIGEAVCSFYGHMDSLAPPETWTRIYSRRELLALKTMAHSKVRHSSKAAEKPSSCTLPNVGVIQGMFL